MERAWYKAAAEADTAAADAAREAAEADAAAAETARLAAEAETATANAARELAVAARVMAAADATAAQAATETAVAEAAEARTAQQAAETARDAAEVAQRLAEDNANAQVALAETANMAVQVADAAVVQANADLIVAQDKQKQAEDDRDAAEDAADEADRLRRLAVADADTEEQRRQQAEAERDQSDQDAEDARAIANRAQAKNAFGGLDLFVDGTAAGIIGTGDPAVTPRYRASASVTTGTTGVTFVNPTTGTQGRWFRTAFSNTGGSYVDRMDVYSDAEQADKVDFKDSIYNQDADNVVVDGEGDVVGSVAIMGDQMHTASSAFPRTSGPAKSPLLVHRGMTSEEFESARGAIEMDYNSMDGFDSADRNTQEFRDALKTAGITRSQYNRYVSSTNYFRNTAIYPFRYTYSTGGTLQGASGIYRCGGATMANRDCTVQNSGDHFVFVGPWTFRPSSGTTDVLIDDSEFMYFGWWSRQAIATEDWSFRVFHGPTGSRATDVSDVSGTATYQGPAVGQYAIYQPLGTESGHGAFSATATLTADFDSTPNTVHGTIDQFSGHSDWSLTLKHGDVNGGLVGQPTVGVSWSIGGNAHEGGSWSANFYSNLASDQRTGVVPSGIAGTFEAEYTEVGRLIGAFGAHCRTGC